MFTIIMEQIFLGIIITVGLVCIFCLIHLIGNKTFKITCKLLCYFFKNKFTMDYNYFENYVLLNKKTNKEISVGTQILIEYTSGIIYTFFIILCLYFIGHLAW